ncbi:aminodeoxychorismate/anthranilate synthase component II [Methanobrevibacter sp. TMH8]|uniref:anthranilate synthase component II n=1 Tax=Methanobrevibacter sp. TMH8 TaxID=2848611 RepID=UPI001CCCEBD3|nr:aminodeoxychorismate/anthranilate synthase component II [Methanobrevibacter sp. TMH8]MBZ9570614.1 aminodeoxychorismate/anthranilate synthase component II [Methanobrevibacter sp. TMH8]
MILLVDNYDSFSYNLYQMIGEINSDIKVIRNDELELSEIRDLNPDSIVISPGPGRPIDAGFSIDIVKEFYKDIPILGICLGHQCIYEAFGGEVSYSKKLVHGKTSNIEIDNYNSLFSNLNNEIIVGRYHSLSGIESSIPNDISLIAKSKDDDEIMAIVHKNYNVYGLQFHPESILTPDGSIILKNFLEIAKS